MRFDVSMVEGAYLRDILAQPRALADTVASLCAAPDLALKPFDRVVLTGMGASYHALQPLFLQLVESGLQTLMLETAELIHYFPAVLTAGTLLVAVSQSGGSVETVRLLDAVAGRVATVGVTNTPESPLGTRADLTVLTRAGTESSVSCKTYVTTIAALEWLGAALRRCGRQSAEAALQEAAQSAESYLRGWERKVSQLFDLLAGVGTLFVTGRGASVAAAGTGGLILKESAHFHAEGMTCSAFRHGPFELTGPGTAVLVFAGDERTAALNANLAADVRNVGGKAFLIGAEAQIEAFRLPLVSGAIRPVVEILPLQLVSLALAAWAGHRPGKFKLLTKVTTIE
ncbi:MAG: SIS domain-containing protein [Bryobacteraceae bacterium]|jgi:glucosamine--fructose-6-phosphate aminotransferase (isomerizing)